MKIASQLVTKVSGSIGGLTGSHNKGGLYFRARAVPTNPNTQFQQAVRNAVAQLSTRWGSVLTAAQRAAWKVYAENVPLVDTLGEARIIPALAMYVRSNVPRLQAGMAIVDAGPTVYQLATFSGVTAAFDATADEVDVTYVNTDDWADTTGGALLIWCSRPLAASIEYFKGPYRYTNKVLGNTATPPTSPATMTLPFPVAVGNQVALLARASNADGRLSSPFRLVGTAA